MKRVALLIIAVVITVFLCIYITDYRLEGTDSIGYQEDVADDMAPVHGAAETWPAKTTVPASLPQTTAVPAENFPAVEPFTDEPSEPEGWQLAWADEFDKSDISMEYWTEMERRDNFNEELQYYSPANSFVENGVLVLEARKENKDGKHYTSGMVQTMDKMDVRFGRVEARISLPVGKGFFPAFWMLPYDDKSEIDVMEMIGSEPTLVYGCNHYMKGKGLDKNVGMTVVEDPEAFHVYAIEWDKESICWYVDGQMYYSTDIGIPEDEMYLILTLAVGGDWPGSPDVNTVFPSRLTVDYIRYYRAVEKTEGQ